MGYEFELKFRATPELQDRLLSEETLDWQTIAMETTYYDTADAAFSNLHCTLRTRLENGVCVCTLKTPAGSMGRGEWECRMESIEEALPVLCAMGAPKELEGLASSGLVPVCGARFTRRAGLAAIEDTTMEIAVDRGVLFSGSRERTLCEIEVELKSGSEETAAAFARELAARYGLTREKKSKFRRALELKEET